jgi:hypothetical protein
VNKGELTEEEANVHPQSNVLVGCLGSEDNPPADMHFIPQLRPGDVLMACTDGVWHYFSPSELGSVLSSLSPREATEFLIEKARRRARGAGDNLSLLVVKVEPSRQLRGTRPFRAPAGAARLVRARSLLRGPLLAGLRSSPRCCMALPLLDCGQPRRPPGRGPALCRGGVAGRTRAAAALGPARGSGERAPEVIAGRRSSSGETPERRRRAGSRSALLIAAPDGCSPCCCAADGARRGRSGSAPRCGILRALAGRSAARCLHGPAGARRP